MAKSRKLTSDQQNSLLKVLQSRFKKNMNWRKGIEWSKVQAKLEKNPGKLWSLDDMETTGGEPDVVGSDKKRVSTFFMIVL
jgi:hypothetical protein